MDKEHIQRVYAEHKGRYGYRRIAATLRQTGLLVNHKTVQRLMSVLRLKSRVRPGKYRSYRGPVGPVAPNLLERRFEADKPNEKWVRQPGKKAQRAIDQNDIQEAISWFNHERLLEPIGYISPAEAEAQYYRGTSEQALAA